LSKLSSLSRRNVMIPILYICPAIRSGSFTWRKTQPVRFMFWKHEDDHKWPQERTASYFSDVQDFFYCLSIKANFLYPDNYISLKIWQYQAERKLLQIFLAIQKCKQINLFSICSTNLDRFQLVALASMSLTDRSRQTGVQYTVWEAEY
jgi:hypothetical protein